MDQFESVKRNTRQFLLAYYLDAEFRLASGQPWLSGAEIVRRFDDLSPDEVRLVCDDILDDLEASGASA